MEHHVAIGVPDQRRALWEGAAAEMQRAARTNWMCIIPPADANAAPWERGEDLAKGDGRVRRP